MLFIFNISSKSSISGSYMCFCARFTFATLVRIFSPKKYIYSFWLSWCLVELASKIK